MEMNTSTSLPLPPIVVNSILSQAGSTNDINFVLALTLAAVASFIYPELDPELRPANTPLRDLHIEYDFIIVGGGTAGSVLTNRLSEIKEWKILLLEAGGDETALSSVPFYFTETRHTSQDWNYTTKVQKKACKSANHGRCAWPIGRGLGGSSAINGMFYVRGNKEDYDTWQSMGNPGWGYESMLPYFLKSEDNTNVTYYGSPYHRTGGYQTVSYSPYRSEMAQAVLNAAEELGYPILDFNGDEQLGFNYSPLTVRDGVRCSAAKAFLRPTRSRPNVHISQNSLVSRILIRPDTMTAFGVEFIKNNQTYIVRATKEIVVSAGAVNTPHLLMLSGIGPREQLEKFNIEILKELPVGKNLHDHLGVRYNINLEGVKSITNDVWARTSSVLDYAVNRTGPLTSNTGDVVGFVNTNESITVIPNIQFLMTNFVPHRDSRSVISLLTLHLSPNSRGQVSLQSANINVPPLIDPAYFTVESDLDEHLAGAQIAMKLIQTSSLQKYNAAVMKDLQPMCQHLDDEEFIRCLLQHYTETVFHPVGTCKMGPVNDTTTVVSSLLQVHGINSLRVIDASIMPVIPRGNTNAPTIAIAEKGSDLIKIYWNQTVDNLVNITIF